MAVSREDEFRTDAARVVQVIRQHLPAPPGPGDLAQLSASGRRLERLLDAGAPAAMLRDAAIALVDACEWPGQAEIGGDEGLDLDPAILAAVERLRAAVDAMDAENGD